MSHDLKLLKEVYYYIGKNKKIVIRYIPERNIHTMFLIKNGKEIPFQTVIK